MSPRVISKLITGLALLLWATISISQNIYIWEDENGIQHFSDRKPETNVELTVQRALAEPQSALDMQNLGTDQSPKWMFTNRLHGPLTVEVRMSEQVNTVTDPALPHRFTIKANSRAEPVIFGPLNPAKSSSYRIESIAVPGVLNPKPNRQYHYQLPLVEDQNYRISQGFYGSFSHNLPHSQYALDIELPTGTPIHAARAGVVMDMARYFHQSGLDLERDGPRSNFVRILHDDGSMAVYAHLDYNAISVRPGQSVRKGQKIGHSGNTGYSTGPHLHFSVQINQDMNLVSIPFQMQDHDGRQLPETAAAR